ncbi:uncharacterized protein [Linepithema humile]|uniref:uncharacterized protein n=1 Tax=Linepithema humile TaxID=83485 RepID=UPI00351F6166
MWEKVRVDGKRILKSNAIPSIFEPICKIVEPEENNTKIQLGSKIIELDDTLHIASNDICTLINKEPEIIITANTRNKANTSLSRFNIANNDIYTPINEKEIEHIITSNTGNEPNTSPTRLKSEKYWKIKYEKLNDMFKKQKKMYDSILRKSNKSYNALKEKIKKLNTEKASLRQHIQKKKLRSIIKKVFTDDQIRALVSKSNRGYKWSENTIKKAIRLRLSCGSNGYKELLTQHIPLPSIRTLQKRLETLHFREKICEEILDILKIKVDSFEDERDKDAKNFL